MGLWKSGMNTGKNMAGLGKKKKKGGKKKR